ncbi:MAG TPA: hypothetical protein VGA64_03895 [Candidatus Polarisedimenticolia bacterium]
MARRSRSTFKKHQKEVARQQRQQGKLARRLQRNQERQEGGTRTPGDEDPDLAGIQPGPQPRADDEEFPPTPED